MSELFIRVFLDENMDVRIASILRAKGFIAKTTDEAKRKGTNDADQLKFATEIGFALLTMNRVDFERLATEYFYTGKRHCGIIIVSDNPPNEIAQRLANYLDFNTADEIENQIIYL